MNSRTAPLLLLLIFFLSTGTHGQSAPAGNRDDFTISTEVDEIVLHVSVRDGKGDLVVDLKKESFSVYEDGQPMKITSFRHEDTPVSLGIVVDNSGSMSGKRPAVNQAALNLVDKSNPEDEVFIVNFNYEPFVDQDFTSSLEKMKEALEKLQSRGKTKLYDAIVASADHLREGGKLERRVLVVITDGEDNGSTQTLERAVERMQDEKGIVVYAIGLLGEEKMRHAKRALDVLAKETGGIAFFPKNFEEVDRISEDIAQDIRSQYTVHYKPPHQRTPGERHTVEVKVRADGYGKLTPYVRSGYISGQPKKKSVPVKERP